MGSWWTTRTSVLNVREQCVCSDENLGHIRKGLSSVLGEFISLCLELMRLHLQYSVECWPPQYKKGIDSGAS